MRQESSQPRTVTFQSPIVDEDEATGRPVTEVSTSVERAERSCEARPARCPFSPSSPRSPDPGSGVFTSRR